MSMLSTSSGGNPYFRIVSYVGLAVLSNAALAAGDTAAPEQQGPAQLVSTDELIGRDVVTQEGQQVGTVEFVTVSLDEGNISHLVVDPSNGELLIVPWDSADLDSRPDQVTLTATGRHISSAPRLKRDELNQLTEPAMASYVIDYWAPPSELAAMEGRQRQDSVGAEAPRDAQTEPEKAPEMRDPQRTEEQDRRLGTSAEQPQSPDAARGGGAVSQPPQSGTDGSPVVLVGQEVVTSVSPPMFQLSQDLEGSRVTGQNGEDLGKIRRILIDADTGDAAFAVLEETPSGSAAVPLQSLEWTAEGTTLLTADTAALQPDPALTGQPSQVDRKQLAQLYQRFDVEPYWQRSGRTSTRSTQPELPR